MPTISTEWLEKRYNLLYQTYKDKKFTVEEAKRVLTGIDDEKSIPVILSQIIASLLSKTEYVEEIGSGINRIKKAMRESGLEEPIFEYNHSFLTILNDKTGGIGVTEKVTENQIKILNAIKENKNITVIEIAKKSNISRKSVLENISKLKQKNLIRRIGPDKGGYWEILKDG